VGKLVAAFVFFLAASALAIHESKPPPRPVEPTPTRVDETPTVRAVHDDVPPWVKYATPPAPPKPVTIVLPQPPRPVITVEPTTIEIVDSESGGDIPDVIDRCPDQPNDNEDNDGCPEPEGLRDRIILID
jgi:hypothetical protein